MLYFYNCNVSIQGEYFRRCRGAAEYSSKVINKNDAMNKLRKELFSNEVQPFRKDIAFKDCHFDFTIFKLA